MMTNTRLQKHKAPQNFITILFIFSILAGMLSSCSKVSNGVDIAITSTGENPATQNLTLVPETEVATQMPTIITLTSEPTKTQTPEPTATATATETPIPTEVEKYPIDLEKLSTTPESYQYLLDHKEEFVKGPDPLEVGMEEFFKWYTEKLIPSLGDYKERDGNVCTDVAGGDGEFYYITPLSNVREQVKGQMEFWYFEHDGIVYPVLEVASITVDKTPFYSVGVVLVENFGSQKLGAIKDIKDGQKIFGGITLIVRDRKEVPVSVDVHKILERGFFFNNGGHVFGIGAFNFFEP
jgi:hypothetical protein